MNPRVAQIHNPGSIRWTAGHVMVWLLCVLLLAFASGVSAEPAPVRLALVSEGPEASSALDLLTVSLTKQSAVALLERAEVDRVYREQALAAGAGDYVKLGEILGADGLLVLSPGKDAQAGGLSLRLVSVRPGVIISSVRSPWPVEDGAQWAEGMARRFAAWVPKLAVRAGQAIPLSLVNLHSALQSAEGREAERCLSVLAVERLSREPELFVLERQRMELLSAEQELKGVEKSAFWDGSYVLEGVLDRDGYSPATITLNARLVPPKGGAPIEFDLRGSRTNLARVVEELAQKVIAALKLRPSVEAWKPADEAQRYFAEAQWAHRWELYGEAAAACETSWALGLESKDVAELRIRSYFLDGLDASGGSVSLDRKLVAFAAPVRRRPGQLIMPEPPNYAAGFGPEPRKTVQLRRAMELYADGFRRFVVGDPKPGWVWHDLGLDILENASYTLMHYYYMPEWRAGQEDNIAALRDLARELAKQLGTHPAFANDLQRSSPPMSISFHTPWHSDTEVRFSWAVMQAWWGGYWYATPEQGVQNYRELLAGGYFPQVRRFLLQPDFTEQTGVDALNHGSETLGHSLKAEPLSYLAGWTWETRRRATSVWHGFIDELCCSTNRSMRLEGLYLRSAQAITDEAHDRAFAQLLEALQSAPLTGTDVTFLSDIDTLLATKPRQGFSQAALNSRTQAWTQLKPKLLDAKASLAREAEIRARLNYLAAGDYDFRRFSPLFSGFDCNSNEAQILLPALVTYRTNLPALAARISQELAVLRQQGNSSAQYRALAGRKVDLATSQFGLDRLEQTLRFRVTNSGPRTPVMVSVTNQLSASPPVNPVSRVGSAGARPPGYEGPFSPFTGAGPWRGPNPGRGSNGSSAAAMYGPAGAARGPASFGASSGFRSGFGPGVFPGSVQQGTDPASLVLSNVLAVSRYWPFPDAVPGISERVRLDLDNCFFREGRLWVDTRYANIGGLAGGETFFNRGVVLAVDLDTFQCEPIALDPATTTLPNRFGSRIGRRFEVQDGCLYVSSENEIRRYLLKAKKWETLPVPVQGHGRICGIGGRLFLTTDDSILEVLGTEARILASTRRRPAQTPLDELDGLGSPPLSAGPEGAVRVVINGSIYQLAKGSHDWKLVPTPPSVLDGTCAAFDGGLLLATAPSSRSGQPMRELVGLFNGTQAPELLLSQPNASGFPGASGPFSPGRVSGTVAVPRWPLPMGVYALNYAVCLDGETLWVLASSPPAARSRPGQVPQQNLPRHAVLFGLEPGETNALAIGLEFASPGTPVGGPSLGRMRQGRWFLEPAPQGLVAGEPTVSGLWVIPRAEIERRREAWRAELRAARGGKPAVRRAAGSAEGL